MTYKKLIISLLTIFLINGCDLSRQISEMTAFSKCDFRLYTVEGMELSGVGIQNIKTYSDLSLLEIAKIGSAFAKGVVPLSFTLNVQVKNPNSATAAMNNMEWILFIDDIEILEGKSEQRTEIPPNGGIANIPLQISADLMKVLTVESAEAISNFAFNLTGQGNRPTRIMLKIKPTIMVGGIPITYPGYISVRNEFTSS